MAIFIKANRIKLKKKKMIDIVKLICHKILHSYYRNRHSKFKTYITILTSQNLFRVIDRKNGPTLNIG